jgi:hypothetical protein
MRIYDCIDNYIEEFVQSIRKSDGKIKKTEIYKKFTERYPDFTKDIFHKEKLEKYLIDEVSFYTGVDFIEDDTINIKTEFSCQKCGNSCVIINDELICSVCKSKHMICDECDGNRFKINYNTDSIFEEVDDCPACNGMGTKLI